MTNYTKNNIGSGYNTTTSLNAELEKIETAVNSKLDKTGGSLSGDLSMESNDLLNVNHTYTAGLTLNGNVITGVSDLGEVTFPSLSSVTYTNTGTGAVGRPLQDKLDDVVSVKDFGAVGDGVTDDTAAIQAALDYASANNKYVNDFEGSFKITTLTVDNGIRGIDFTRGTLQPTGSTSASTDGVIRLTGGAKFGGAGGVVRNAVISVRMDMSNGDRTAIFADGTSDCVFEKCRIFGFTDNATLNHYGLLFWHGSARNRITQNNIVGFDTPTQRGLLVDFVGDVADFGGYFSGSGTISRATSPCVDNVVSNNILTYGSYAVNLIGSDNNVIVGNLCSNQDHRAIFLASSCWANNITGNQLLDYLSSAVVLSYGSSFNSVVGNQCYRETGAYAGGTGEASINIFTGSKDNVVSANNIHADCNYGVYMGPDSQRNVVQGNSIENFWVAGIALENDWVALNPTNAFYSRPNYASPGSGTSWSFNNAEDNVIQNNVIKKAAATRNVCGIYVSQINGGTTTSTANNLIKGNVVSTEVNLSYNILIYAETEANLSGLKIEGNDFDNGNLEASYTTTGTTTWHDKLSIYSGNSELDKVLNGEPIDFSDGDTTPSVSSQTSLSMYFKCNNTGSTSITTFDDGYEGQEITVRLDSNTTLVHDNAAMRLRGAVNYVGSSNEFARLKKIGTIWYEVSRS